MKLSLRSSAWIVMIVACVVSVFVLDLGDAGRVAHAAEGADDRGDRQQERNDVNHDPDEFDRGDDDFDDEGPFESDEFEDFDVEEEEDELDLIRDEVELQQAEMEHVTTKADIAGDHLRTAALAIERIGLLLEQDQAIRFLEEELQTAEQPAVIRLIRLKLADLYAESDRTDQLREQLRLLIHTE